MLKELRVAMLMLIVMTALTGFVYPLAMTGVAQVIFSKQANGSLIPGQNGTYLGSELIGQPFDDPQYFWSRPSATGPFPYNAGSSSGSNLAVTNPAQVEAIKTRLAKLRESGIAESTPIPVDLITASGSGLDPHISPEAARIQVPRIARVRHLEEQVVGKLVEDAVEGRQFGILGEPRVNVLKLNIALDSATAPSANRLTPK